MILLLSCFPESKKKEGAAKIRKRREGGLSSDKAGIFLFLSLSKIGFRKSLFDSSSTAFYLSSRKARRSHLRIEKAPFDHATSFKF